MKQLIVMISGILLAIFIFGLIMGKDEGSIVSNLKNVWQSEVEFRSEEAGTL